MSDPYPASDGYSRANPDPGSGWPPPRKSPPPDDPVWRTGFVIVRLSPGRGQSAFDDLPSAARELKLTDLVRQLGLLGNPPTRRLVTSVSPARLVALENQARERGGPFAPRESLSWYWRIDLRASALDLAEVAARLTGSPDVDLAYPERIADEPAVQPFDDVLNPGQDYLDDAPVGVGARWAWSLEPALNGTGRGIGLVDVERGWRISHEDLVAKQPKVMFNGVHPDAVDHGTRVLGVVVGVDNDRGVVGVAPGVTSVRLSSHFDPVLKTSTNVADAISAAWPLMAAGDVLLLEVQTAGQLPAESDPSVLTAVQTAVSTGVVVVAAAGNGWLNLDVELAGAPDSGAVLVGAATAGLPHERYQTSNYGARVNCYAWGEGVVTTSSPTGVFNRNVTYTAGFGQTSGASAVVAGVALVLQGLHQQLKGVRLTPPQLRAALCDPSTGTAQGGAVPGPIGVMPDLCAIATALFGALP